MNELPLHVNSNCPAAMPVKDGEAKPMLEQQLTDGDARNAWQGPEAEGKEAWLKQGAWADWQIGDSRCGVCRGTRSSPIMQPSW